MKVAVISISQSENKMVIKTHSLKKTSIFPSINNEYRIDYDKLYRPVLYTRKVCQKNLDDYIQVDYNYQTSKASMQRTQDNSISSYAIQNDSRDVFSFIAYLASGLATKSTFLIDANGCPWQAKVSQPKREEIKTAIGEYQTNRYEISFIPLSKNKTPYYEMVTHNFVNEDTKLILWVADNKLPAKATVRKNAVSMNWELTGLKP